MCVVNEMQTLEAMISFVFFLSVSTPLLLSLEEQRHVDDSLYRIQLAEDVWRVLYLRGNFADFQDADRDELEKEFQLIGNETGLCVFMDGVQFTNCRGNDKPHDNTASLTKTVICNGEPRIFTFSLGR